MKRTFQERTSLANLGMPMIKITYLLDTQV
jgi:hypothetical protein